MYLYIGIALVALGIIVFVVALVRSSKGSGRGREDAAEEDLILQKAFEIVDAVPDNQSLQNQLLSQDDLELRLLRVFDELALRGDFASAKRIAKLLVDWAPDLGVGYSKLGLAALRLGEIDEACEALKRALEIDPEDIKAANNLGYIYNSQKRYAEAAQVLESVLGEDEGNVVTLVNLGIAKFHLGDVERAYELLNAAYKKNPRIPEVHLYLGHCLKEFGDTQRANKAYRRYKLLTEGATEKPEETSGSSDEAEPSNKPSEEEGFGAEG